MVQRARTASALNSAAASLAEGTAFGAGSLAWIRQARRREISGRLFCLDFNSRIERYQLIRDRELLHYLDPLGLQSISLDVRHRDPAVDPADAEPVKNIRHQLLKAHVLHTGDALGAAEIADARCRARALQSRYVVASPRAPPSLRLYTLTPTPPCCAV